MGIWRDGEIRESYSVESWFESAPLEWGRWIAYGSPSTVHGLGLWAVPQVTHGAARALGPNKYGVALQQDTDGTINNAVSVRPGFLSSYYGQLPWLRQRVAPVDLADTRYWFGFSSNLDISQSDNPGARHIAAIRRSTGAADTNYVLCTKDGTTIKVADMGVAPVSGIPLDLEVRVNLASVEAFARDMDGQPVGYARSVVNLPSLTVNAWQFSIMTALVASVKQIDQYSGISVNIGRL